VCADASARFPDQEERLKEKEKRKRTGKKQYLRPPENGYHGKRKMERLASKFELHVNSRPGNKHNDQGGARRTIYNEEVNLTRT